MGGQVTTKGVFGGSQDRAEADKLDNGGRGDADTVEHGSERVPDHGIAGGERPDDRSD